MKNNRKDNIPSDGELFNTFRSFCSSDEDAHKAVKDARKAFTMLNKNKEFRNGHEK